MTDTTQCATESPLRWRWAIDNVIPIRDEDTAGIGKDRNDCMRQFRAAWEKFSSDPARLTEFLQAKRKRL